MDIDSKENVPFDSLVGEHMLDAVDMDSTKLKQHWGDYYEDANVIRFRIDGKVYAAVENPEDGYRSSMEKLFVSEDQMKNAFAPVKVLASVRDKYEYGGVSDVLEFRDVESGMVILAVGTENTDDYYPYFVGEWSPQNMAVNRSK